MLASGGGTNDQKINFWSSTTGTRTNTLETATQVTSLIWSPHAKELLSTHGFPNNNICVWSFPSLSKICDLPAHESRILSSAISPDGCQVATAAADENLKFWNVWEMKSGKKGDSGERTGNENLKAGMSIR
jgi:cell division cycle protein 20 (cofactor of APC complex)